MGLIRWPFLVPYLARTPTNPHPALPKRSRRLVFQSFNRYLGVAVGEHLGYGLTGAWSLLVGAHVDADNRVSSWLGVVGVVVGAALMLCSLEFVGRFEPRGWKLAETVTPIAYIVWSLWLVAVGVALLACGLIARTRPAAEVGGWSRYGDALA